MIDWLTLRLPMELLTVEQMRLIRNSSDRIMKVSPQSEVIFDKACRQSIRTDSHQLVIHFNETYLSIQGSPARLTSTDNVFGSLDITDCASEMITFTNIYFGIVLPVYTKWQLTRCDVTFNYFMENEQTVLSALNTLKNIDGKRSHKKADTFGSSVYWNRNSKFAKGKAYAKGQHLDYINKKNKEYEVSPEKIELSKSLLRLELQLGYKFFYNNNYLDNWYTLTPEQLTEQHHIFFDELVSETDIMNVIDTKENLIEQATKEGYTSRQITNAWHFWLNCKNIGYQNASSTYSRMTIYKYKKILLTIGVRPSDIINGKILPFRFQKIKVYQPVHNWKQLEQLAA